MIFMSFYVILNVRIHMTPNVRCMTPNVRMYMITNVRMYTTPNVRIYMTTIVRPNFLDVPVFPEDHDF